MSACHVHTGWGTPFSAELRPVEPITQESCIFFEDCALFDDEEVQIGGERVDEAVGSFVQLERVAEAHVKARRAKPISPEAARYAKADLLRLGAGRAGFWALVARHLGDPSIVEG